MIQNVLKGNRIDHCVIGIGLNVNQEAFPEELPKATSLRIAGGKTIDIHELIRSVAAELDKALNKMDWTDIDHYYIERLYLKDEMAVFHDDHGTFEGIIRGVDHEGQLLIENDGIERKYSFGEISYG